MAKLVILGTSSAIPTENHENTHLAVVGSPRTILVDCGNNPVVRMQQAGLDINRLTDVILTHFHPDHVSGVSSLLMNTWLMGRTLSLGIIGLEHTVERLEKMMALYGWDNWPDFYPVEMVRLPDVEGTPVLENGEFRIIASPVCHLVPTIALRFESLTSKRAVVYSSDTEPCESLLRLAHGAHTLIHEATGAFPGHSSARQAGEIARQLGVQELFLIHYPNGGTDPELLVEDAQAEYGGKTSLAQDFLEIPI